MLEDACCRNRLPAPVTVRVRPRRMYVVLARRGVCEQARLDVRVQIPLGVIVRASREKPQPTPQRGCGAIRRDMCEISPLDVCELAE